MEQPILCPVVAVTELPACFFCFREIQEDSAKRFPIKGGLVTVVNPPRGEYYGLVRDTNDRLSDCYWTSMCELHTSQYGELRAVVRLEAGPSYRGPSGYFEQERDLEEEQEGDPERGGEGEEIIAAIFPTSWRRCDFRNHSPEYKQPCKLCGQTSADYWRSPQVPWRLCHDCMTNACVAAIANFINECCEL